MVALTTGRALPALILLACCTAPERGTQEPAYDLVLAGGQVVDGSGAAPRRADVGVLGDRIAAVGELDRSRARRVLHVEGLVVAGIDTYDQVWRFNDSGQTQS